MMEVEFAAGLVAFAVSVTGLHNLTGWLHDRWEERQRFKPEERVVRIVVQIKDLSIRYLKSAHIKSCY